MWGNPKLVSWDYGKDINITLEDAVISWEEMRILMGAAMRKASEEKVTIRKNHEVVFAKGESGFVVDEGDGLTEKGKNNLPTADKATEMKEIKWVDMTNGARGTATVAGAEKKLTFTLKQGNDAYEASTVLAAGAAHIRFFWQEEVTGEGVDATELVISPDTYPGTWTHASQYKIQ